MQYSNHCDLMDEFITAELLDNIDEEFDNIVMNELSNVEDEFHEFELEKSEAREYVAGYICHKLKLKCKSSNKSNSWIRFNGEGRLKEPSDKLSDLCAKCDLVFDKFYGKGLRICKDPLGKVQHLILSKYPNFPLRIVRLFCKVKFFARIRQFNVKVRLKTLNNSVRSLKQTAQFTN